MPNQPTDHLAFLTGFTGEVLNTPNAAYWSNRDPYYAEQQRCALDWVANNPDSEWPPSLCALIKAGAAATGCKPDRLAFASAGAAPPQIAKRRALAERAAAERRAVGGPDSLVKRVKRGEENRPWWMEEV